ncbi:MAG TPA: DUF4163 domain-containing protein [Herbinix luporum]|nr:DUF4163 domain-containing protein [Herbinix luporum]
MKGLVMEEVSRSIYGIEERIYQRAGTYVSYPIIVSGGLSYNRDLINNIILEDINNILRIYSADAFSELKENPYLPDTLNINYDIKRNNGHFLSIFYRADFFSPYGAHPTQLVYTTNIDLVNLRRIKLSDIVQVDNDLVDDFYSWELVTDQKLGKDYKEAINEYIIGLGRNILLMGFKTADIIGSDNLLGIFTYLTPDRIGISISVPNYLGDHVEYEKVKDINNLA